MLFRRRDTRLRVLLFGGIAAAFCLSFAIGTPQWTPIVQVPLAAAVWCTVGAAVLLSRRHLPPDLALQWVDPAEAERLRTAAPPPDRTMLHLRFEPDVGHRYRLDVLIDGQRVAQLPAGTACFLPLPPGEYQLGAYLDRPVSMVRETINAIPGVSVGFCVRNHGSRRIELEIRREATLPAGTRLVRPATEDTYEAGRR